MKNLFRYLSPFSPDNSGAVSVLYELGGIIVICDAGGCTGNVCGFDEPRWGEKRSAIFSAGLRDMDAVMGRDDRLINKISAAASLLPAAFIALIGTPVPSVIATDYRAIAARLSKELGIPAVYIETTGIESYERGEIRAYRAMLDLAWGREQDLGLEKAPSEKGAMKASAEGKCPAGASFAAGASIGIWGATPLNLPGRSGAEELRKMAGQLSGNAINVFGGQALPQQNPGEAVTIGMDSGLEDLANAGQFSMNLAVSPSGLAVCRLLENRYGTPYRTGFGRDFPSIGEICGKAASAVSGSGLDRQAASAVRGAGQDRKSTSAVGGSEPERQSGSSGSSGRKSRILVIHQQIYANSIREALEAELDCDGDVASFFLMDDELSRPSDVYLEGENDLIRLVRERDYDLVIGDPLFNRALKLQEDRFIPSPHYAVSGEIYWK